MSQEPVPVLTSNHPIERAEPIAVVGIGCRFPGGADSPEALWRMLLEGRDAIVDVPASRWNIDAWHDADRSVPGKMNMRRAGFLQEDISGFDGAFFGVAPREAMAMDPQQRLLMEVAWEALENAASPADKLSGTDCGVFLGLYHNNYGLTLRGSPAPENIDGWSASGAHTSVAAGRLSYFLNLAGPSMAVDTACSSSLVAVHLALQSLRSGECSMALAGGVHLLLSPEPLVASAKLGATAADGRCKTFDAAADGFGHGEGCGIVVLKRLADAEAAGDRVLAVIRGSCVNQDGRSNSLTAPNGPAQEAAVRTALQRAGIAPRQVGYIEAHGTGTQLGDPIEVEALAEVLGEGRDAPLMVGSVKTNLGHLEAAAGVAGLIKAILCVQHGVVPAHLNFTDINPEIDSGTVELQIPVKAVQWDGIDGRRIAGVSAFGFSGTNAHVVLEGPALLPAPPQTRAAAAQLLALSARTPPALSQLAKRWADWLQAGGVDLADAAFTAGAGRSHHRHRMAVVASDASAMAAALQGADTSTVERTPRIAFLFTGQGSQYAGMAAQAYKTQPVFRATLDRFAPLLDQLLGQPALALLFGTASIDDTRLAQPLVVALELALAAQWRAWGVVPAAVMGHSVGEYAAAAVAGVLSEEDALKLVAERGRLMQALPAGGGMLVVSSSASRIEPLLKGAGSSLAIAARNGPANTAVAGALHELESLQQHLQSLGMRSVQLPVSHAFHSVLLDPMLAAFEQAAAAFVARVPRIPIVSNLTGKSHSQFDATHWRSHARQPVCFFEGMESLAALGCDTFVELGPQGVLSGLGAVIQPERLFVTSLRRNLPDDLSLSQAQAALYRAGVALNWDAIHTHAGRRKLAAPTYAFQRQAYWLSAPAVQPVQLQPHESPATPQTALATGSAVVYDFYDELTVVSEREHESGTLSEDDEGHLTFGFLPAPVPGFSWIRALFEKEENPGARALFLSSQRELKDNLFSGIDFSRMRRVLDYGCGHAADLCELAVRHPHLQLQGFTISAGQVEVGKRRIKRLGLGQRVQLQRSDSSAVPFPGLFDLIFGFEVTGLIADKEGLFNNIESHLAPGGLLVIADFVSTADAIVNPATNSFTPSSAQWVDLLSTRRLRLVRSLDASADVADWLVDPSFESNIELLVQRFGLGELTRRHLLSNENIGKALRLKLMRYLLLTAQHAPHETEQALRIANESMLREAVLYRDTPAARASEPWRQWLYGLEWQEQAPRPLLPDTASMALQLVAPVQREREALQVYDTLGVVLDDISLAYTEAAFVALGCHDLQAASAVSVIEPMRRLRDHLLKTLAAAGVQQLGAKGNADALADQALRAHPAAQAELTLLRRCGPRLADALTGKVDPLSLLFPDGDASLAEALYERSPFSRAVQNIAAGIVALLPRSRPLAVIEVGAGTGATTEHVLPQLPAGSRYLYTDLGTSLLARARKKFAGRGLSFAPLDISLPPSAQGVAVGGFDLAVAANVLHATPDLAQTLSHVRDLLAPGGLLLMVENTGRLNWGDLTFGLTTGMWNFRDTGLRDYALLYQAQWKKLLEASGFEGVEILTPGQADQGGVSQQCVILARRRMQRSWLITGDTLADGVADSLAAELRKHGDNCSVAANALAHADAIPAGVSDVVYLAPLASGSG
ncbi:MAG: beta-ketoacyl synthase N-terminal-like domain-containing protein, partial [Pseudomonadota bacterium]